MDRRQISGSGPHTLRSHNSFIPTTSSTLPSNHQHQHTGSGSSGGSNGGGIGKLGPLQIQQLALQSQLMSQSHHHHPQVSGLSHHQSKHQISQHRDSYYQNIAPPNIQIQPPPPPVVGNRFSHGTLPRNSIIPEPPPLTHHHFQSRTLMTKTSYPPHYNLPPSNGGNPLYGNLMGAGGSSRPLLNGNPNFPPSQHPLEPIPPPPPPSSNLPVTTQVQPIIHQLQQQHHSNKILEHYPGGGGEGDGLPPTLVESMRTLFDILDDTKQGRVRLSDIESRWENSDNSGQSRGNTGAEPLIKMGVMGYLRKVTPPDGMLTFDRFCSGLRLALITNNNQNMGIQGQPVKNPSTFQNGFHTGNINFSNNSNSNSSAIPMGQTHQQRPTSLPMSTNIQQRAVTSRIPPPSSKLPTVGNSNSTTSTSGILVSPKSNKIPNGNIPFSNQGPSTVGTARRIPLTQSQQQQQYPEQTTVAIVHQPPPPNPKPGGYNNGSRLANDVQIGSIKLTKPSLVTPPNGGFSKTGRTIGQNGSLDNLVDGGDEKSGKVRSPSAPILDTTDDDDGGVEYYVNSRIPPGNSKRERARSRDRDIEEKSKHHRGSGVGGTTMVGSRKGKSSDTHQSFGKRVVSFVTPRQRTLSMPQLQLSKLKTPSNKSIHQLDDDSSPCASSSSHSPLSSGETKQGALKSSLKAVLQGSSIPTKLMKQKSDITTAPGNSNDAGRDGHPASNEFATNDCQDAGTEFAPPPPKPPRNSGLSVTVGSNGDSTTPDPPLSGSSTASNPSKPEIRKFLQSWKQVVSAKRLPKETEANCPAPKLSQPEIDTKDGLDPIQNQGNEQSNSNGVKMRGEGKRANLRRRETARRHTVQSGIDFATLKRLKQLEQERDLLQQGLTALEKANGWYTNEMERVDEKIALLTKGSPLPDHLMESLEERLNLLSCRITEVNGLLAVLMDASARLPNHMNLQIPSHLSVTTITRLKEQNRQLTQEVSDCSHRVTQLETEKALLLRQLFHQKNTHLSEETVYM